MRKFTTAVAAISLILSGLAVTTPAYAQYGMDKKPPKGAKTPELPHCAAPLGTAAVQEPENRWWTQLGLSSPEALIKLFAAKSGCLRIVDRNAGLAMRDQERDLAGSGDLQRGSNIGRGQVKAADFFLIPDIANSNNNSGGNAIGAVAGSFLPGGFGALARVRPRARRGRRPHPAGADQRQAPGRDFRPRRGRTGRCGEVGA